MLTDDGNMEISYKIHPSIRTGVINGQIPIAINLTAVRRKSINFNFIYAPDSTAKCNTLPKNFGRGPVVQAFPRPCV